MDPVHERGSMDPVHILMDPFHGYGPQRVPMDPAHVLYSPVGNASTSWSLVSVRFKLLDMCICFSTRDCYSIVFTCV